MSGIGIVLLLIGGSGITNAHGDLQLPCLAMVAVGLALFFLGRRKSNGRD